MYFLWCLLLFRKQSWPNWKSHTAPYIYLRFSFIVPIKTGPKRVYFGSGELKALAFVDHIALPEEYRAKVRRLCVRALNRRSLERSVEAVIGL